MLSWANKVVLVTGAGAGIGREYALFYGRRGATVVVNDLGSSVKGGGQDTGAADKVVAEIKSFGGKALADYNSVVNGDKIIKNILQKQGKIDVIVNNAGILRDSSFLKMTLDDWRKIMEVHVEGVFSITNSAWKTMRDQKFGRIVNTTSGSGLYGAFGQVNYAAAKLGLVGMTYSLAKEGKKYNIGVNAIAPLAASRMTESLVKKEDMEFIDPKYIVPLVGYLTHDECKENGSIFEIAGGYIAKLRYQRSEGAFFNIPFEVENVKERMNEICDFSRKNEYPVDNTDVLTKVKQNISRIKGSK